MTQKNDNTIFSSVCVGVVLWFPTDIQIQRYLFFLFLMYHRIYVSPKHIFWVSRFLRTLTTLKLLWQHFFFFWDRLSSSSGWPQTSGSPTALALLVIELEKRATSSSSWETKATCLQNRATMKESPSHLRSFLAVHTRLQPALVIRHTQLSL